MLLEAGREDRPLDSAQLCARMAVTPTELREDINVLNLVNFGGGSYVLYAEMTDAGVITVDREAYADHFDRPARLLPIEAKALVAAIDLIGEHLPQGSLQAAREKIVAALGCDPSTQGLQIVPSAGDDARIARLASEAIAASRTAAPGLLQDQRGSVHGPCRRAVRTRQRPRRLVRRDVRSRPR